MVLDDWFHSTWPGVVEGYYQFVHSLQQQQQLPTPESEPSTSPPPDIYPFLICESKLYLTNDKYYHQLYYDTLLQDTQLNQWISPYAHEKTRGKLKYKMNGMHYLKCNSRQELDAEQIQQVWSQRVY